MTGLDKAVVTILNLHFSGDDSSLLQYAQQLRAGRLEGRALSPEARKALEAVVPIGSPLR